MKTPAKPRSRRAVQHDVDLAFVAIVLDAMHRLGLHEWGTGLPLDRAAELLREGKARGVTPSAPAIEILVDELAGRLVLPTRSK